MKKHEEQRLERVAKEYFDRYKESKGSLYRADEFTQEEINLFEWFDKNPEILTVLGIYYIIADRKQKDKTLSMWPDGMMTGAERRRKDTANYISQGQNLMTSNIISAGAFYIAGKIFDDPNKQIAFAGIVSNVAANYLLERGFKDSTDFVVNTEHTRIFTEIRDMISDNNEPDFKGFEVAVDQLIEEVNRIYEPIDCFETDYPISEISDDTTISQLADEQIEPLASMQGDLSGYSEESTDKENVSPLQSNLVDEENISLLSPDQKDDENVSLLDPGQQGDDADQSSDEGNMSLLQDDLVGFENAGLLSSDQQDNDKMVQSQDGEGYLPFNIEADSHQIYLSIDVTSDNSLTMQLSDNDPVQSKMNNDDNFNYKTNEYGEQQDINDQDYYENDSNMCFIAEQEIENDSENETLIDNISQDDSPESHSTQDFTEFSDDQVNPSSEDTGNEGMDIEHTGGGG